MRVESHDMLTSFIFSVVSYDPEPTCCICPSVPCGEDSKQIGSACYLERKIRPERKFRLLRRRSRGRVVVRNITFSQGQALHLCYVTLGMCKGSSLDGVVWAWSSREGDLQNRDTMIQD